MQHSVCGHSPFPTPGPLHWKHPLAEALFPQIHMAHSFPHFPQVFIQCHLISEASQAPYSKVRPDTPESPFLPCLFQSTYYLLTIYMFPSLFAHCQSLPLECGLYNNRGLCVSCSHCLGPKKSGIHCNCCQMTDCLNMVFPPSSLKTTEEKQKNYEKKMRKTGKYPNSSLHTFICAIAPTLFPHPSLFSLGPSTSHGPGFHLLTDRDMQTREVVLLAPPSGLMFQLPTHIPIANGAWG